MKLSDYILMSDVDGTLVTYGTNEIPERNIEAIKRFTDKGGSFGIATGRSKEMTEEFVNALPVNAPCVVLNGGGLYDYSKDEFLMQNFLPDIAKEYLKQIMADVPDISVLVITDGDYYHINHEIPFASFTPEYRKKFKNADIEKLMCWKWYKVLFSVDDEECINFHKYVDAHEFNGVRFVNANENLIEMLPETSSKGYAIKKLVELGYFSYEGVAAIGDYYNDYEMLEYAATSATTIDSPDELKAVSTIITGKCEYGAVADFIEYLESKCEV